MEIQVWVGDLAEYNNGRLTGDWFTLPMDLNDIYSQVLKAGNEEIYIGDIDSEIYDTVKNMGLRELNELAEKMEDMEDYEKEIFIGLVDYFGVNETTEILENGNYSFYSNCNNMEDVAYEYYENSGQLSELTKYIDEWYIDFEAIGRDMEINGTFIGTKNGYIEIY